MNDIARRLDDLDEVARWAFIHAEATRLGAEYGISPDEIIREAESMLTRFAEERPGPFDAEAFHAWAERYLASLALDEGA